MHRRLLDPRNDLVFKRIFGEHPDILRAFLNAVLPLPADGKIESLEYLSPEQVPEIPLLKNTIVDVRCRDQRGRQFIVEMQMNWTNAFMQRVLFNASKAYVRQLDRSARYELLEPVIGLSLLDDTFDESSADWFHHYRIVNVDRPDRVIEGLQLVFIELPKFHPGQKESPLSGEGESWLRFLVETGDTNEGAVERLEREVATTAELKAAVKLSEESAFTRGQLEAYDLYWDIVRRERTLFGSAYEEGIAEGRNLGREEGLNLGREEGLNLGREEGRNLGREEGLNLGREEGLNLGREEGLNLGREEGLSLGREEGMRAAVQRLVATGMEEFEAKKLLGLD